MNKIIFIWTMCVTIPVFAGQSSQFVYDDKGLRDPLWPLVSSSGTMISYGNDITIADMVLEGIITDTRNNKNNIAIINGNVIKAKDKIGLYIVERIEPNSVSLVKDNKTFSLVLPKGGKQ